MPKVTRFGTGAPLAPRAYLAVDGLTPDLGESGVDHKRPLTDLHFANHDSVRLFLDPCSGPCIGLVHLPPIRQGGFVLKDPFEVGEKEVGLGTEHSPVDLRAAEL